MLSRKEMLSESIGRSNGKGGFSTIDLLAVSALFLILMALAVPAARDSFRAYELTSAAEQLAAELNAARVLAISRGTVYRVDLNVTGRAFRIIDVADANNPTRVEKRLGGGIRFSAVPNNPIIFSSKGGARGGTIRLETLGGKSMEVEVGPAGRVKVKKLTLPAEVPPA